jgi:hypothetical protein
MAKNEMEYIRKARSLLKYLIWRLKIRIIAALELEV